MNPVETRRDVLVPATTSTSALAQWTLAGLSLCMVLSTLGTSIANVALPTLARTFDAPMQEVQWVLLAYLLSITTLVVSVGRLGDLTGRRQLLMAGICLFTAASVMCGAAPTLWLLIAARSVQGIGAAVMLALAMAFVGETVPKEKFGSTMGLLGSMSAIGTASGPSLGGILIATFGWQAIFFINLPLGILTLFLAYRCLPIDHPKAKTARSSFDHVGTLLLAATLAAYALAMTVGRGSFGQRNVVLLIIAALGVGLFSFVESHSRAPLIQLSRLREPVLAAGLAMSTLVTTVLMATLVVGPFYLSGALALDTVRVGLIMSIGPVVAALGGVPAGRMTDRYGSHSVIISGLVGMGLGSAILSLLPTKLGVPGYIVPIITITAGYALFQAANNTTVMKTSSLEQRGVVSGMVNLSRNLGLITGASVMGTVFAFTSVSAHVTTTHPSVVANGMKVTFAAAAVLIVVALAVAVLSEPSIRRATSVRR